MVKTSSKTCSLQPASKAKPKRKTQNSTRTVTPAKKRKSLEIQHENVARAVTHQDGSESGSTESEETAGSVREVENIVKGFDDGTDPFDDMKMTESVVGSVDSAVSDAFPGALDSPDRQEVKPKKVVGSVCLLRHALSHDPTIQDMDSSLKGWSLISFNEFQNLKLTGPVKVTEQIRWRLGPSALQENLEREVIRIRDLRSAIREEAESQLKSLMLEEARVEMSKIGKDEPHHWDDIRNNWARDSSIENARLTWHLMYGMFDNFDLQGKRNAPKWERNLEKVIMQKMNIAYIRESIPAGTW